MKQYLEDLTPQEVIDRMTKGEQVHYTDSKGNDYLYILYKGVTIRIDKSTGKCDGFNRSIYSTCGAYFETKELTLIPGERYRTRDGRIAITTGERDSSWIVGYILDKNMETIRASWNENGLFYGEGTVDPRDIVEEL